MNTIMQNKTFIIDLDGTLIKGQSQRYLIQYLRKIKKISFFKHFIILIAFLLYKLSIYRDVSKMLTYSLNNFKGQTEAEIYIDVNNFFQTTLKGKYFEYSKKMIELIQENGGNVIVLSAVIDPLVKRICEDLNISKYISTLLEFDANKVFTGNIIGKQVYGDNKLINLLKYMVETKVSIEDVVIITDHISDISILKYFKNSIVANPDSSMKKWARQNNYPIIYLDNNESIQYIKHYFKSE